MNERSSATRGLCLGTFKRIYIFRRAWGFFLSKCSSSDHDFRAFRFLPLNTCKRLWQLQCAQGLIVVGQPCRKEEILEEACVLSLPPASPSGHMWSVCQSQTSCTNSACGPLHFPDKNTQSLSNCGTPEWDKNSCRLRPRSNWGGGGKRELSYYSQS